MSTLNAQTRLTGLIGYPLEHSFSPAMHNAAFAALKLNYVYLPLPVAPGRLRDAVSGFRAMNFLGANVTIPHKEEIMAFLDYITEEARLVGAVNTLMWTQDGFLVGDNTDVAGFQRTLDEFKIDLLGRTATIIGSGGAARAAAVSLARAGVKEIVFQARRHQAIYRVIEDLKPLFPGIVWGSHTQATTLFADDLTRTSMVVNASPVGMYPQIELSPLSQPMLRLLPDGAHVYDMVYNPVETTLLRWARESEHLHTWSGLEMLVYQGAAAFERWTGKTAPVDLMLRTVRQEIGRARPPSVPL